MKENEGEDELVLMSEGEKERKIKVACVSLPYGLVHNITFLFYHLS